MSLCNCLSWLFGSQETQDDGFESMKTPQSHKTKHTSYHYGAPAPYNDSFWIERGEIKIICTGNSTSQMNVGTWNNQLVMIQSQKIIANELNRKRIADQTLLLILVRHPNIVKFLGFNIVDDTDFQFVYEYVNNKTLWDLLSDPIRASNLTWANEKINIAIGVATLLCHLHTFLHPPVIHGKLKSSKVLLTDDLVPKINVFGDFKAFTKADCCVFRVDDIRWSAPELVLDDALTDTKVDIYSFGVLLTELDTCEVPFAKEEATMTSIELLHSFIGGMVKHKCSDNCPQVIASIANLCLQDDPSLRPSSTQVLELLQQAKRELQCI